MKKKIPSMALAVASVIAVFSALPVQADEDLRTESQQAVADFQKADSTLQKFFADSVGYAVFPNVGKGGFIVGGARGKGIVYEKTNVLGKATMTQASIQPRLRQRLPKSFSSRPFPLNDFKTGNFETDCEMARWWQLKAHRRRNDRSRGFHAAKKG